MEDWKACKQQLEDALVGLYKCLPSTNPEVAKKITKLNVCLDDVNRRLAQLQLQKVILKALPL